MTQIFIISALLIALSAGYIVITDKKNAPGDCKINTVKAIVKSDSPYFKKCLREYNTKNRVTRMMEVIK